jgi:hypothetical protein
MSLDPAMTDPGRLAAQEHRGENIAMTETHVLLVELREPPRAQTDETTRQLGPS